MLTAARYSVYYMNMNRLSQGGWWWRCFEFNVQLTTIECKVQMKSNGFNTVHKKLKKIKVFTVYSCIITKEMKKVESIAR